jgi:thioester reductase-like protein
LELDSFGLSAQDYGRLVAGVSRVVHCASSVDFRANYLQCRPANVLGMCGAAPLPPQSCVRDSVVSRMRACVFVSPPLVWLIDSPTGTLNVIKLCKSTGKSCTFISTLSAAEQPTFRGGYAATKYVAEQLVRRHLSPDHAFVCRLPFVLFHRVKFSVHDTRVLAFVLAVPNCL